ncbi:MAG: hypothetical protein SGCHY_000217 [Lobulomycetales sp.]
MFYTSIGVMQRDAPLVKVGDHEVTAWTAEEVEKNTTDLKKLSGEISVDIVETVKVIDFLIDRLPAVTMSEEEQLARLEALEADNQEANGKLDEAIGDAAAVLEQVKEMIRSIAHDQTISL